MTKTTRRFSILFGLFVLLVTVAGVVYAQGRHGGMMGGMMSMMQDCPMMKSMQQGPAAALQHKQELGLTADQVQRLEALQKSAHPGHMQMMGQMQAIHQEIAKATEGERFDEAAARAAFGRMGEMHTEMGVAMLRARHQTQQILTAEQREKLSRLGGGMMGMHGMMMGGMDMKDCPMIKGMMGGGMNGMHKERSGS
ncbi:MAG TPA: Spy/CpxP family protein refolding chaperone [Longimicrobiaceae bacterium]|nr:Spy/CpxP family protein refolding chaperone [Longimicrobiaceae bacterium]